MPFFKMIENVSRHFSKSKKIRVALLIDEFFGGAGTAYGGYGFLARKFIAKYIPDEDIEIDVLLGKREKKGGLPSIFALKEHCEIKVLRFFKAIRIVGRGICEIRELSWRQVDL